MDWSAITGRRALDGAAAKEEGGGMSDVVFYICFLIAIILCAGTPDLLDAITVYVLSLSKVCP